MPGSARLAASLGALGLLVACEPPVEPIGAETNRVLVHAVLDLGASEQMVLLEQTQRGLNGRYAIEGATVTLTTPGGITYTAIEATGTLSQLDDPAPGGYRLQVSSSSPGFTGGSQFTLRIVTRGDTITGTTTMPQALPASGSISPVPLNRQTDTLRLQWPRVPGARGYQVGIYTLQNGGPHWRKTYATFADTSIVLPGTIEDIGTGRDAFPRGVRVTVVVAAVDDNYHSYYRETSGPFTGAAPSRLTGGALGVFGSLVPILVRSYNVR